MSWYGFQINQDVKESVGPLCSLPWPTLRYCYDAGCGYAASCLVSDPKCEVQAVAYHYLSGKVTYMYWGKKGEPLMNARTVTGKNIVEFVEETKHEFGIEWMGTVISRTTPPADYGVPPNRWQFSGPKR